MPTAPSPPDEPDEPTEPDEVARAVATLRGPLLDDATLVRASAGGRRRGEPAPRWTGVELRYVDLKDGRRLQVTGYDGVQAHTANHATLGRDDATSAAAAAVDELLAEPFGHWHVETTTATHRVRVTKKGRVLHDVTASRAAGAEDADQAAADAQPDRSHDRRRSRMLAEDDPVLVALGISDHSGRVKPSRQAKYRQVEALLRALAATLDDAVAGGHLAEPTPDRPLRLVDLGCGNAYLTFAAHRWLATVRGWPVHSVGVDVKEQARRHNTALAQRLGPGVLGDGGLTFVQAGIADVTAEQVGEADVVLALHACDTATDDALARAVAWRAPVVLAAPCCHHDVAAQLRGLEPPAPYRVLTRHGILRERLADTLTDALRAGLLRREGYRVDVVEFVESKHTPRNTLIRAVRTGRSGDQGHEAAELAQAWGVRPRLGVLLEQAGEPA